ncbi:hypothetical protein IQ249_05850 [Lusitaniella coriacea LEGE 07157]|uniref:Uncharacterized protein n=1 Tax=Lusitaniella coriacea LEGE 07157 TaxID=945747 RepID=A0A8J7B8F2_9CYAN|nr:hypothetical protein [Lusitaniella coriacea]MBE9115420.1 hypothetical protein [Lusitaniella coriacea LEGE 07157]
MLRDVLKQEIDRLNDNQLQRIAEFLYLVKSQTQYLAQTVPFWQKATPTERAQDFLAWVEQLPKTGVSLPDEAFDRGSIYE